MLVNNIKNRQRDPYSFANINLLGRCNADCFFCLGKDIERELKPHNQIRTHFKEWKRFPEFLETCSKNNVKKLYITGQNTDSLLYEYLHELIPYLKNRGFGVGLRTNGYMAIQKMDVINQCNLNVGYSIHTLDSVTNRMILGRTDMPDWEKIIPQTNHCRVSIVLNRCNKHEFFEILKYVAKFPNVKYVQVRRVSTDTRLESLAPDMVAYEEIYSQVRNIFPLMRHFASDVDVFEIYGKEINFWRTIKTSVNSMNYFTDGTVSDLYFIVEGYKKYAAIGQGE